MGSDISNYFKQLRCSRCGETHNGHEVQTICVHCGSHLLAEYDLARAKNELDRDKVASLAGRQWKWAPLMPVEKAANQVFLGEGGTPILPLAKIGKKNGAFQSFWQR